MNPDSLEKQRMFAAMMNGEVRMNKTQMRKWRDKQHAKTQAQSEGKSAQTSGKSDGAKAR